MEYGHDDKAYDIFTKWKLSSDFRSFLLVCGLCKCKGQHANLAVWTQSGLSEMFCQNDTNGCCTTITSIKMCSLSSKDPSTKTRLHEPSAHFIVPIHHWKQLVSCSPVSFIVFCVFNHVWSIRYNLLKCPETRLAWQKFQPFYLGVSGVSSASSCSSASSYKTCTSGFSSASLKKRTYTKQGYQPLRTSSPSPSHSPERKPGERTSAAKKDTTPHGHKVSAPKTTNNSDTAPENNGDNNSLQNPPAKGKLSLIREFQREFANGKSKTIHERKGSASSQKSGSTRIK